jgi:hypothetical protein
METRSAHDSSFKLLSEQISVNTNDTSRLSSRSSSISNSVHSSNTGD